MRRRGVIHFPGSDVYYSPKRTPMARNAIAKRLERAEPISAKEGSYTFSRK